MCHHNSFVTPLGEDSWKTTLELGPVHFHVVDCASYLFTVMNLRDEYNCMLSPVNPPPSEAFFIIIIEM